MENITTKQKVVKSKLYVKFNFKSYDERQPTHPK